jgi:hypothetical protein
MLGQKAEPRFETVVNLLTLQVLEPTIEGGAATQTTTAVDLGVAKDREEIFTLDVGATDIDLGFARLLESVDGDLYQEIAVLPLSEGFHHQVIQRKGRYLKVKIDYEYVQPDEMNPVASSIPLSIKVLQ